MCQGKRGCRGSLSRFQSRLGYMYLEYLLMLLVGFVKVEPDNTRVLVSY